MLMLVPASVLMLTPRAGCAQDDGRQEAGVHTQLRQQLRGRQPEGMSSRGGSGGQVLGWTATAIRAGPV
jgi:hypothetical protein